MKTKTQLKTAAMIAGLALATMGVLQAQEADTNATTVAYWKLNAASAISENPITGVGIPDLATNVGQGTLGDAGVAPVSVDNLWALGPMAGSMTFSAIVPPGSLFNGSGYFSAGSGSWDVGADEYSGSGGELSCDNTAYGAEFNAPSFTQEIIFKTDYTNDPTLGTVKQTLIWNHRNSAYAELQLNESADSNTNDIGSLLFWGWNVVDFPFVRITAAQNGGHRFDDGQWHYACCRYDAATLTMSLLVVNEDGTTAEATTYIGSPLNPGGSGSQGPFIIGNDEGGATPFNGLINQARFSNVAVSDGKLLGNVSGCNLPVFHDSPATNAVAVGGLLNISPAYWLHYPGAQVDGGPLQLQWQVNGTNVTGQTNLNLNLSPVSLADAGTYQLIASTPCGGLSVTSAPTMVKVSQAVNVARWSFESTETNTYPQATVDDVIPGLSYDLITFNDAPNTSGIGANGEIALTNVVPPTSMFINGNNGGTNAFDPSFIAAVNGVVFYTAGPDVFDFQASFSLELFFKTYGDQSGAGPMELICQGTDGGNTFRYGVNVNQAGPGAVSFKINNFAILPAGPSWEDTNAGIQSVVLSNKNYADGNWHYLLAQYDSTANQIKVTVANEDGSATNAILNLPVGYGPLPNNPEGNLFVGRYRYPVNDGVNTDPRTFLGAIDEVQVSSGLVTPASGQLGYLPGVVAPSITSISVSGSTVTITFTGSFADPASAFTLVGSSTVNGIYSDLSATITSLGGGNFQAVVSMNGNTQFYKVKR
jgi:hypothetical protein